MSTGLTAYADGDVISAASLRATSRGVEKWLNESSLTADLDAGVWCTAQHLFPPFVYGEPTPRWEGQTAVIASRGNLFTQRDRTLISNEAASTLQVLPVPRLATRIRVTETGTLVRIKASWFSYCQGRNDAGDALGTEATLFGKFDLYVNGAIVLGTSRRIYFTRGYGYYAKKQHGLVIDRTLNAGTHDIDIRLTQIAAGSLRPTIIECRGFVVACEYR